MIIGRKLSQGHRDLKSIHYQHLLVLQSEQHGHSKVCCFSYFLHQYDVKAKTYLIFSGIQFYNKKFEKRQNMSSSWLLMISTYALSYELSLFRLSGYNIWHRFCITLLMLSQQNFLYSVKVLFVLISWVSAWQLLFACTVTELGESITNWNPEAVNTTK